MEPIREQMPPAEQAALDYHRAHISLACKKLLQDEWTPMQASNHRQYHNSRIREIEAVYEH